MDQAHSNTIGRAAAPYLAALIAAAVVLFHPRVFGDGDIYWHLATGNWILEHGQVPRADIFSYSAPGRPWVAHEWLSEVFMALAHRAAGWSGLVVLTASAVAVAVWLFVRRLSQSLRGPTLLAVSTFSLIAPAASLLTRPHILVLPVVLAWTLAMFRARDQQRAPPIAWALLLLLWSNMHASYIFGLLVAGFLGLEALVEAPKDKRLKVMFDWGLFGVISLIAASITPLGVAGAIYPFQTVSMKALPYIVEWRAIDIVSDYQFTVPFFMALLVCLHHGVKVPLVRLALLLLLVFMALQHIRHLVLLGFLAPLILADPLAKALNQPAGTARAGRRLIGAAAAIAVVMIGARLALPNARGDDEVTPKTALAAVRNTVQGNVLNGYSFGGYLIFNGVRPFIDGRADMYGDDFTLAYVGAISGDAAKLKALTERYAVAWTIFPPDQAVIRTLDSDPTWRRAYGDEFAVVHVRNPAQSLTVPPKAP